MPFLTQAKTNWKFIAVVAVLAVIVGVGILGYLRMTEEEFEMPSVDTPENFIEDETADIQTYRSDDSEELKQQPQASKLPGSPVDHETYLQIQKSTLRTWPYSSQPIVIEESLRFYDINNNGNQDVLGFLKLTFSHDSNYIFSTWHRSETGFDYYQDGYDDFRLSGELSCSIADLAVGSVTLACGESGQEYLATLRYQESGIGYYRDVDAHVVTFDGDASWHEYISKKGGIRFGYPPDITISETTYEIYEDLITVITGKRSDKIIFDINSIPNQVNTGWSSIGISQRSVFLKLPDNTYLVRNWTWPGSYPPRDGIFYNRARVGSQRIISHSLNVEKNRGYILFSYVKTENELKEVDNIFSSVRYLDTPAVKDEKTVVPKNNPISFVDAATLQIPGHLSEQATSAIESNAIEYKNFAITFIDSPVYLPSFLSLELYPFGSIEETTPFGGSYGYNAEKDGCYSFNRESIKSNIVAPQEIGPNRACQLFWPSEGSSVHGYYIFEPNKKYILTITQDYSFGDWDYRELYPRLEEIVESVRFFSQ